MGVWRSPKQRLALALFYVANYSVAGVTQTMGVSRDLSLNIASSERVPLTIVRGTVIRNDELPDRMEGLSLRFDERRAGALKRAVGYSKKNTRENSWSRRILPAVSCYLALALVGCGLSSSNGSEATFHAAVPAGDLVSLVGWWRDAQTALQFSDTSAHLVRLRTIRGVDNHLTYLELVASLGDAREVTLTSARASDEGVSEIRGSLSEGMIANGPPVEDVLAAFDQLGGDAIPNLLGVIVGDDESLVYDARGWSDGERTSLVSEVPLDGSVYRLAGSRLIRMTALDIRAFDGRFTRIAVTHMVPVPHVTNASATPSSDVTVAAGGREQLFVVVPIPFMRAQSR